MGTFELTFRFLLPAALILLMFGMGLGLTLADFLRLRQSPAALLVGLGGQLLLLPILALTIAATIEADSAILVGLIIIAASPGGLISNVLAGIARADTALSVSLTAINSALAVVTIPLIVGIGLSWITPDLARDVDLPIGRSLLELSLLTLLPILLGMLVRHWRPQQALRAAERFRDVSAIVVLMIIVGSLSMQWDFFLASFLQAGLAVVILNLCAMVAGGLLATVARLPAPQRATLTLEVGLQNSTLAVTVALTLMGDKAFAVTPSVYAVIMMITGLGFAWLNARRSK